MSNEKILLAHLPKIRYTKVDNKRTGDIKFMAQIGATFAGKQVSDDKLILSIAVCSKKESFNKKKGRKIATGRLEVYLRGEKREALMNHIYTVEISKDSNALEAFFEQVRSFETGVSASKYSLLPVKPNVVYKDTLFYNWLKLNEVYQKQKTKQTH